MARSATSGCVEELAGCFLEASFQGFLGLLRMAHKG